MFCRLNICFVLPFHIRSLGNILGTRVGNINLMYGETSKKHNLDKAFSEKEIMKKYVDVGCLYMSIQTDF